jgi:hypothetical protein
MATHYGITHVRYNAAGTHIDQVRVNTVTDAAFTSTNQTMTRTQVVEALKKGHAYLTLLQRNGKWEWGAEVERVTVNGTDYIRTDSNKTARDNLGSLPTF